MKKILLGNTNLEVSQVGFGVLTVGRTQLNFDVSKGAELISYALERGINFLDTAQYYETYPYIREALRRSSKDPVIMSKCLHHGYEEMEAAIDEARTQLNRDVIDIFLLHELRGVDDFHSRSGAWQCLCDAKNKGIINAMGISTHHVDVAAYMINVPECEILFPIINYKGLGIRKYGNTGRKEEMAAAIEAFARRGGGTVAMKVFGGGILLGEYQKALDYVYSLSGINCAMLGFGKTSEVDDIISYLDGNMKTTYNPNITNKRITVDQGDCEGCGACIERCPAKAIKRNTDYRAEIDYDNCLSCGYCAPVCPVRAIIMLDK